MNQQEVEQWIAQQGGASRVQHTTATKVVDNPAITIGGAEAAGVEFDPTGPKKITVQEQKWTAVDDQGKPTGAVLHVGATPGSASYEVIAQGGANPATAGPANQTPAQQNEATLNAQRAKNAALPPDQDPLYETDQERQARGQAVIKQQGADAKAAADAKTKADAEARALQPGRIEEPVKGKPGVKVVKTTNPQTGVTETHYENDAGQTIPPPVETKPPTNVSAPASQRLIEERVENPDGTFTVTTRANPNWKPESKVVKDESTGKWIQITETAEGGYTIKPVDDTTTIKPADLPVLQAKYGEISQGLGALAADLNGRYARGEITEKQRNDAFAAGHQQASTQISEINTILTNSQSAWRQEIEQRGQTLTDTAGRRTFAGGMLSNAISAGTSIANSSGPGHGAAIAGGVGALLNIGQRYAEGMGGFRESPEIQMPAAVRQARDVNLPGFGGSQVPGAGGSSPAPPAPVNPAPVNPGTGVIPYGTAATQTADAGGAPRVMTPSGGPGSLSAPQSFAAPGMNPLVAQMAQQLQGASSFAGSPAAAGGAGVFDPLAEGERMLGSRSPDDIDWGEAVRLASQAVGQPRQPGYARFSS